MKGTLFTCTVKKFKRTHVIVLFFFLLMIGFNLKTKAQVTTMKDYAVFGGDVNCPSGAGQTPPSGSSLGSGCRVHMGVGSVINGNVGSYHFVEANGGVTINGNIYSGGRVNLANGDQANRITAANGDLESGNILSTGSAATINGNVDVNGNVYVNSNGGSTVAGTVTHPVATTYSGPLPGGGEVTAPPSLPVLPVMPAVTALTCPTGSATNITGTAVITPGSYGDIILGNAAGQTITFSGPGNYFFNSIKMGQGPTHTFIYDFNNLPGKINIYVCGDVNMGHFDAQFANPSDAAACRIYFETHGTGATNGGSHTFSFVIGSASHFYGTVWSPYAAILIANGTIANGHFWSATQVNIQHDVVVNTCQLDPPRIPDFTPTNDIDALSFLGGEIPQSRDFVVNIFEILNAPSTGQVQFRVRKVSAFNITYNPSATTANVFGGEPVNNPDWDFTEDANFITVTLKVGHTINGFSVSSCGFNIARKVGIPKNTTQNITVTIITGSGGDSNSLNNQAVTSITAN